jgi:hypothetical protein
MGLLEWIIEKIFPRLPDEEMAGIILDMRACWEVPKGKRIDSTAFFRGLASAMPTGAILCLEGTSIAKEVKALLEAHKVEEICKVHLGTSWPRPAVYHVPCAEPVLSTLAELTEKHAEPEICDHLHVYKDGLVLLSWYDAFLIPLYISKAVQENDVKAFCEILGRSYRDGSTED